MWRVTTRRDFQYLNGAIQRRYEDVFNFTVYRFQYLNGAIQSPLALEQQAEKVVFQYLNGAIQSSFCGISSTTRRTFNTSTVRFRVVDDPPRQLA